ncbi:MAG: sigma-70 family RNA polymerase sigma factor [Bacteroidota bacterium]
MKTSNQDLIYRLQAQDRTVVGELYDLYSDTLYGIVLRIVQQEALAQDVLQESFVKIWKNGHKYDNKKGTLFTWMLNICRNTAIDKTRSANYKRQSKIHAIDQSVYNNEKWSYEQKPDHIGLQQEVVKLEEKYREIIELIYFQGYTQQEVTEHLNIPLGTVKSRVRIGLRELRKLFLSDRATTAILFYMMMEQFMPLLPVIGN